MKNYELSCFFFLFAQIYDAASSMNVFEDSNLDLLRLWQYLCACLYMRSESSPTGHYDPKEAEDLWLKGSSLVLSVSERNGFCWTFAMALVREFQGWSESPVFGGWCLEGGLYPAGCSPLTPGSVGKRVQGTGVTRDINTDDSSRPGRPPVHLFSTSDISQWSFA